MLLNRSWRWFPVHHNCTRSRRHRGTGLNLLNTGPHALSVLPNLKHLPHSLIITRLASIMGSKKMRVSLVGLGFGAEFIPIYQAHPLAEIRFGQFLWQGLTHILCPKSRSICQRTESKLNEIGDQFNIAQRHTSFEDVLADPEVQLSYDAVSDSVHNAVPTC